MSDAGHDNQPGRGNGGVAGVCDPQGGAYVLVAVQQGVGTLMLATTSRRSASAEAHFLARNPAGLKERRLAANCATASLGAESENIDEIIASANCVGGRSDSRRQSRSLSSTSSGGKDPAHPAYAPASTSVRGMVGCHPNSSRSSAPPNDNPTRWGRVNPRTRTNLARQSA